MTIRVIGIDACFDGVTKNCKKMRDSLVYPLFNGNNFTLELFQGTMAEYHYVKRELSFGGFNYITGSGHGAHDVYCGDWLRPIFKIGAYDRSLVAGAVIHLLSCKTGMSLGPDFVKNGCSAFLGYKKDVVFPSIAAPESLSQAFFECDSAIDVALANGYTVAQAYHEAYQLYTLGIDELLEGGHIDLAASLQHNRDSLVSPIQNSMFGSQDIRLF